MPVPGIPTPIAFFKILALNNTSIFSGFIPNVSGFTPNVSAALATQSATAIGSVHPIAGITSFFISSIICCLSDSIMHFFSFVPTKIGNSFLSYIQ